MIRNLMRIFNWWISFVNQNWWSVMGRKKFLSIDNQFPSKKNLIIRMNLKNNFKLTSVFILKKEPQIKCFYKLKKK